MKTIRDWRCLEEYGIKALTGEADRTGQRLLCDLTPDGKDIVLSLLGIPPMVKLEQNWNSKAVASMMLPYGLFKDLAVWCLLFGKYQCPEVYIATPANAVTWSRSGVDIAGKRDISDDEWDEWLTQLRTNNDYDVRVIKINNRVPGEGDRATHAMSGRTT